MSDVIYKNSTFLDLLHIADEEKSNRRLLPQIFEGIHIVKKINNNEITQKVNEYNINIEKVKEAGYSEATLNLGL